MKRITIIALLLAVGALVIAGCGGSGGGSSSAATTTTASSSGTEATNAEGGAGPGGMVEISTEARACLKEKGVELPEFKGGEGGPPGAGTGGEGEMPEPGEMPGAGEAPEAGEIPKGEGGEGSGPGGEGGPPAGFGGAQSESMKKAFEECGVETPEFKGGPGGAAGKPNTNSAAFRKQVKEYVACVRENGFELAEPDFSGEGPVFEKVESESAAFKKASAQCQNLLGGPQATQSG
jgi:hypothetical protein